MPRASVDMIKNFDLMLPPKTLQEDFSLFILQVDKLKFEVQKSLDETQMLFDSLMQEYFG
jgi:type I restriction enzyme S subunit